MGRKMKLSHEEIRSLAYDALKAKLGERVDCWIESVYDDEVVYHSGGKSFKAPFSVDDGKASLGDPVEVKKVVSYKPVFSVERLFAAFSEDTDGDMVIRRGKIFEAGDYPDKGVDFTDQDLAAAASSFAPVENDIEHRSTILDGHLGKLQKVWQQGSELFGELALPKWLDKTLGPNGLKVSLAFDANKRIVGNGLVLRPRIADAAVFAAFSEFNENPGNPPEPKQETAMKTTFGNLLKSFGLDAAPAPDAEVTLPEGFSLPPEPKATTPAVTPPPKIQAFSDDPQAQAMQSELDAMKAQFAAMAQTAVKSKAYEFADHLINVAKKAIPAQRDGLAQQFVNAVQLDAAAAGGAMFSAETGVVEGASVASLRKFWDDSPANGLTGEAVQDANVLFFATGGQQGGMSPERRAALCGMTETGRTGLEAATKN